MLMVRVSPLATASWVPLVPAENAASAVMPNRVRRAKAARRDTPGAAAGRPGSRMVKLLAPCRRDGRGLFGEGRLARNGYRPVKSPTTHPPLQTSGLNVAKLGRECRMWTEGSGA